MAGAKKEKKKKGKAEEAPEEKPEGESGGEAAHGEGDEAGEGGAKKKLSGKTLVLFIALPAVVLIAGGVGAAFFLGLFGGKKDTAEGEGADGHGEAVAVHTVFFDMPELLVNLSSGDDKTDHFLKLSLSLELPNAEATKSVEESMPRIIDTAQVFLRELRLDDLEGSAGMLRLREELLRRVDAAVAPIEVHDVLFKEIIIQ